MTKLFRALALVALLPHVALAAAPTTYRQTTGADVVQQLTSSGTVLPSSVLPIGSGTGTIASGPALAGEITRAMQAEGVATAAIAAINSGAIAGAALVNGHLVLTKLNGQTVDVGALSVSTSTAQTLAAVASSGSYLDLTNRPTLSAVAISGSYADLLNKPTIPTLPTLAPVATSGAYGDLTGRPTIPAAPGIATTTTPGLVKGSASVSIAPDGTMTAAGGGSVASIPATGGVLATNGTSGAAQAATPAQIDAAMTAWFAQLPTTAPASGWWNNGGLPARSN